MKVYSLVFAAACLLGNLIFPEINFAQTINPDPGESIPLASAYEGSLRIKFFHALIFVLHLFALISILLFVYGGITYSKLQSVTVSTKKIKIIFALAILNLVIAFSLGTFAKYLISSHQLNCVTPFSSFYCLNHLPKQMIDPTYYRNF